MELGQVLAGTRTNAGLGSATRGRRTLSVFTRAAPTTCQIKEVLDVKGWRAGLRSWRHSAKTQTSLMRIKEQMKLLLKQHQSNGIKATARFDQRKHRERPSAAPRRQINPQLLQVAAVCDRFCQTDHQKLGPAPPASTVLSGEMKAWPRPLAHLRRSWGSCRRRSLLAALSNHFTLVSGGKTASVYSWKLP